MSMTWWEMTARPLRLRRARIGAGLAPDPADRIRRIRPDIIETAGQEPGARALKSAQISPKTPPKNPRKPKNPPDPATINNCRTGVRTTLDSQSDPCLGDHVGAHEVRELFHVPRRLQYHLWVGPGRCRSPRYRMPFNSRNEGSNCIG